MLSSKLGWKCSEHRCRNLGKLSAGRQIAKIHFFCNSWSAGIRWKVTFLSSCPVSFCFFRLVIATICTALCESTKIEKSKAQNSNEKTILRLLTTKTVFDDGKLIILAKCFTVEDPFKTYHWEFEQTMLLSKLASADISWWIRNALTSKRRIDHGKISHTLYTDTSTQRAGGASLKDNTTGGWSSSSEEGHHINYLELRPFSWACSLFVRKCPMNTLELWLVIPLLWSSHFERSPQI